MFQTPISFDASAVVSGVLNYQRLPLAGNTFPGAIKTTTKAVQEIGTAMDTAVTPNFQQHHKSAIKAWINYDARTTPGTIIIRSSYNVSSVTYNGVGDHTVVWDVDFADADNYCWVGSAMRGDTAVSDVTIQGFNSTAYNGAIASFQMRIMTICDTAKENFLANWIMAVGLQ